MRPIVASTPFESKTDEDRGVLDVDDREAFARWSAQTTNHEATTCAIE